MRWDLSDLLSTWQLLISEAERRLYIRLLVIIPSGLPLICFILTWLSSGLRLTSTRNAYSRERIRKSLLFTQAGDVWFLWLGCPLQILLISHTYEQQDDLWNNYNAVTQNPKQYAGRARCFSWIFLHIRCTSTVRNNRTVLHRSGSRTCYYQSLKHLQYVSRNAGMRKYYGVDIHSLARSVCEVKESPFAQKMG